MKEFAGKVAVVTGGASGIGRSLVKALLAEGHGLTVLSRNPASVSAKCGAGVRALASLAEWHPAQAPNLTPGCAAEPSCRARKARTPARSLRIAASGTSGSPQPFRAGP